MHIYIRSNLSSYLLLFEIVSQNIGTQNLSNGFHSFFTYNPNQAGEPAPDSAVTRCTLTYGILCFSVFFCLHIANVFSPWYTALE